MAEQNLVVLSYFELNRIFENDHTPPVQHLWGL